MSRVFLLAASFCFLTSPSVAQQTRFVDDTGVDAGDCTDPETPCATLGFAVEQAEARDLIDIAEGVYTESIMLDKSLTLQGAGRDETVIQAHEEPGQANERVITISGGQETEIVGATIRHGRALSASGPEGFGGGLYNDGGVLTLSDVAFEDNEADLSGGGVYTAEGDSLVLTNAIFDTNTAGVTGGGLLVGGASTLTHVTFQNNEALSGLGGGMYTTLTFSSSVLTDVAFTENTASTNGGGLLVGGTAMLTHVTFHNNEAGGGGGGVFTLASSSSVLTDVTFTGNSAEIGGGMNARPLSTSDLTDVEFIGNSAGTGGGMTIEFDNFSSLTNVIFTNNVAVDGGGMFSFAGSSTLENVVFSGNEAEGRGGGFNQFGGDQVEFVNTTFLQNTAGNDGGGIWSSGDALTLTNVTVSGNVATVDGGGLFHIGASGVTTLTNTIIWGNTAGEDGNEIYNIGSSTIELFHSLYSDEPGDIVEGGGFFEVENSLTEDPLFVDSENGNLRLTEDSPAIDAGDPDTDLALFPTNDEGDPIDLDGELRIFGDAIDIGAYERHGTIDEEASPEAFAEVLGAPTPNPARGSASLTLRVAETQNVVVEVFDVTGRRVQRLYDGVLAAGTREVVTLDASTLPGGAYVIRATGEDFTTTRRVTVVR